MNTDQIIEKATSQYTQDKYAMYLRKSRADIEMEALGEGETLAKHKTMLFNLAARHDILPSQITIYQEIVSGESIQDRPEVQRLLEDVYAEKYKGVLVVEVERLARGNTKDQGEVAEAFQMSDTKIITPVKVYDPDNEFDQEYFEFGLFMSRREFKTIRRRLEAGKLQAVLEGNYLLPQRVFGYNIVRKSKDNRYLVINEEERPLVQMMFDWFTEENRSCDWIAKQFTSMGIPTMQGSREWHKETISCMLKNKLYIGIITWGKSKTVKVRDPKTGKVQKKRVQASPEEVKYINGKHKPIISEAQFRKAQGRFKKNPINHGKELVSPLAGLIHCADCGKALDWINYKDSRGIRYSHKASAYCKKKSLRVEIVFDALVEALEAHIEDFEFKMNHDGNGAERARHLEKISRMDAELEKLEKKRKKLFDDYEDEVYTKEEFIERKQVYAQSIADLKAQLAQAKADVPEVIDYSERIITLQKIIETFKDPALDAQAKNDFLKEFIEDIRYDVIDYGRSKGGKPVLEIIFK